MVSPMSLGQLAVRITADLSGFETQLQKMKGAIKKNLKGFQLPKDMGAQGTTLQFKQLIKHAQAMEKRFAAARKAGLNMSLAFKQVGANAYKASMGFKYMNNSLLATMRRLMSFRDMFGKIMHYITFSIGVQMVMLMRQAIMQTITSFIEFERAITNAATVSGYLGASFESVANTMERVSKELGRTTVFSANEVAKAYYNLASAGYDVVKLGTKELLPFLNYAAATQSTLEESTYAVATALKAFNLDIEDAGKVVDVFTGTITNSFMTMQKMREAMKYAAPIAGILNVEFEATAAALAALVDRGMEGSQAGQRLNMIFTKLLKPTEKAREMMAGLGIAMSDIDPTTHDLIEILYTLQSVNFGAAESANMFRARTAAAAATLVDSVDDIARFRGQLKLTQGVTQSLATKQIDTLWGSLELLKNRLNEAGLAVMKGFAPGMRSLADAVSNISVIISGLSGVLTPFVKLLVNIGPVILGIYAGVKLLTAILPATTVNTISLATGVSSLGLAMKGLFVTLIPLQLVLGYFATKVDGLSDLIFPLITAIALLGAAMRFHAIQSAKEVIKLWPKLIALLSTKLGIVKANIVAWFGYGASVNVATAADGKNLIVSAGTVGALKSKLVMLFANIGAYTGLTAAIGASTAALHAFKIALAATGVGLILVAIGLVAGYLMSLGDEADKASKALAGLTDEQRKNLKEYSGNMNYIISLTKERLELEEDMREQMEEGIQSTEKYADSVERLARINDNLSEAREKTLGIGTAVINQLKEQSEAIDKGLTAVYTKIDAEGQLALTGSKLTELEHERDGALQDYTKSLAENGAMAEETTKAYSSYIKLGEDVISLEKERGDIYAELEGVDIFPDDATKEEREVIRLGRDLIETQNLLIQQETDLIKLKSARSAIESALYGWQKLMAEATRDLWEKKLKLLEIEEKLYKLQQSRPAVLEEIFEALAQEGMLNADIIQQYKDMLLAQAELTKERMDYTDEVAKLGETEQTELGEAMGLYDELIRAGVDAADAWSIAFEGVAPSDLGIDLSALGIEMPDIDFDVLAGIDMSWVKEYADVLYTSVSATMDFGNALTPLLSSLEEAGVLTAEIVKAFHDYLEIVPKIEDAEQKRIEALAALEKEYTDLTGIMSLLWRGVAQDGEDGSTDMQATWSAMMGKLGFLNDATESYFNTNEGLQSLLSDSTVTWKNVTDAQLIAAAAVLAAADNEELAITNTTTLNNLISQMNGAPPFEAIETAAYDAVTQLGGMPKTLEDINLAIAALELSMGEDGLAGAINALSTAIDNMPDFEWPEPPPTPWDYLGGLWDAAKDWFWGTAEEQGKYREEYPSMFQKGIKATKGAQLATIGEAGAEAVIPLEGKNKKFGVRILEHILPKYFGIGMQRGGIAGNRPLLGPPAPGYEILKPLGDITEGIDRSTYAFEVGMANTIKTVQTTFDDSRDLIIGAGELFYHLIESGADEFTDTITTGAPGRFTSQTLQEIDIPERPTERRRRRREEVEPTPPGEYAEKLIDPFSELVNVSEEQLSGLIELFGEIEGDMKFGSDEFKQGIKDGTLTFQTIMSATLNYMKSSLESSGDEFIADMISGTHELTDVFKDVSTIISGLIVDNSKVPGYGTQGGTGDLFTDIPTGSIMTGPNTYINPEGRKRKILTMDDYVHGTPDTRDVYQRGIFETTGTQFATIGEAGAEAVVPLEGRNRKYGERILKYILPKYFKTIPGLQRGGLIDEPPGADVDWDPIRMPTPRPPSERPMDIFETIAEVLISFKDTTREQLEILISEFTIDQEDLEIDSDEFNSRVKDGSISFKAIILNAARYLQVTFNQLINNFSDEGDNFYDAIASGADELVFAIRDMIRDIENIQLPSWGGNGDGGGDGGDDGSTSDGGGGNVEPPIVYVPTPPDDDDWRHKPWPEFQRGGIFNKPTFGMFGEEGTEAIIPLEGVNKKFGEKILQYILPRYFRTVPGFQEGGIFGATRIGTREEEPTSGMNLLTGILDVLTIFSDTTKLQLETLSREFVIDEEDLEIDTDEFNERIKDGTISFKAIMMTSVRYMQATFDNISDTFSKAGASFFDDIDLGTDDLLGAVSTMVSLIENIKIPSAPSSGGGGDGGTGGGDGDGDGDPGYKYKVVTGGIDYHPTDPDKFVGKVTSSSGETRTVVEGTHQDCNYVLRTHYQIGTPLNWQRGGIFNKPTMGVFGEAGAEALVPLERNKEMGMKILESIIPKYYPELLKQEGGVFGGTTQNRNVTYGGGDSFREDYTVTGPVTVVSQDPIDFMNQIKQRYRASSRR